MCIGFRSQDLGNGLRVPPEYQPPGSGALLQNIIYEIKCASGIHSWIPFQGFRLKVQGSGFRGHGSGFRVQGLGFRVQGSGFQGSRFGV